MRKMYIFATSFLAISGLPATAAEEVRHNSAFTGFSIGAQADYDIFGGKENFGFSGSEGIAPYYTSNTRYPGVGGKILLSYGTVIPANKMYIGLEGNAALSSANTESVFLVRAPGEEEGEIVTIPVGLKLKAKDSYGIHLRVGRVFNNVLPYAKVGLTYANFQQTVSSDEDEGFGVEVKSTRKFGFEAGAGVEFQITPIATLGAEYSHGEYPSIHVDNLDDDGGLATQYTSRISSDKFGVRLKFKVA